MKKCKECEVHDNAFSIGLQDLSVTVSLSLSQAV